jgi:DNA-binding HxlR family transcriptional regulator
MPSVTEVEACPFQTSLEILGRRHMLSLLWIFQQKSVRRFTEIRRASAMNPVTLSERLGELEVCGIVTRTVYNETPPRVEYELTDKGTELLEILDVLAVWAKKHPPSKQMKALVAA